MSKKNIILTICISLFLFLFLLYNFDDNKDINKILKTNSYSYLNSNTKEYVKKIYADTGELILTEKNKKINTPYLNPEYDAYLALSDQEKQNIDLVPNTYVLDYAGVEDYVESTMPSYYNLTNVSGKNYTTPFYDQKGLGICWTLASLEQAESLLLVRNKENYSLSSQRFSSRQMDYATSIDGINNYENENGYRPLTSGGNYYMSSLIMSYGLSMVDYDKMPFNENTTKKELSDVLNYKNSKYELDSSIMMPKLESTATTSEKNNYINKLKEYIMRFGGAYVGTGSPTGSCGFKNTNGTYTIVDADNCIGSSGHALQIIGWDDNYEYSYCRSGSNHNSVSSSGTCSQGTKVSSKGAWILRNSWGDDTDYKYVYLGYNSYGMDINFTTSVSKMEDRTWDNVYNKNIWKLESLYKTSDFITYNKKIDTPEKVEKVKIMTASLNGNFNISIETDYESYDNIASISTDEPGIYTIDLRDKNIVLEGDSFEVIIESTNNSYLYSNTISVFTSNIDNNYIISANRIEAGQINKNSDGTYEFISYAQTKNINSNEAITYSLFKNGTNYDSYILSVSNNKVAINNVNSKIILNKDLPIGTYKLRAKYGDYYSDTDIIIPAIHTLEGSGTTSNPYKIYDEEDLNQIRYNLDAYYTLEEDILLTEDWIPIGTYNMPFKGGLDGKNHSIMDLTIDSDSDEAAGLFGYVEVKSSYDMQSPVDVFYREKTYIKNIQIWHADIYNKGNAGVLIGQLTFNANNNPEGAFNVGSPNLEITGIHFIGGQVYSSSDAGVIIGNINIIPRTWNTPSLEINNVFASTTVSGEHSAGLIGYINDSYISGSGIMLDLNMTNFQTANLIIETPNNSKYSASNNYSYVVGGLFGNAKITLKNYIINSRFDGFEYTFDFDDSKTSTYYLGHYDINKSQYYRAVLSDGYYISKYSSSKSTSISNINSSRSYLSWENFDDYWKVETIDSKMRIPVLKDIEYIYSSIDDISIKRYETVYLEDYINPCIDEKYIKYEVISNNNIIDVAYTELEGIVLHGIAITGLSNGTATIRVTNNYDGLEKVINVNVTSEKVSTPTITYYSDKDRQSRTYTQTVTANTTFSLEKNHFTKPGYTFKEWNTIPKGNGTSYTDEEVISGGIDENINLYAQWDRIRYEIVYNANGGSGTMSTSYAYYDYATLLSSNKFTRSGYTFKEWNTKPDGTGLSIGNGETFYVYELDSTEEKIINLYAQWIQNDYVIRFNSNGGIGVMSSITVTPNTSKKLPENIFTKEGYIFKNWNTSSSGNGTSYSDGATITPNADMTLYAIWQENPPYDVNRYELDEVNNYIDKIDINTTVSSFKNNFNIGTGYLIDVDYKTVDGVDVIYTGGKTKIYKGQSLYKEFTNIVRGDVNGDGKINYLDYVSVYNHIYKTKNSSSDKKLLTGVYAISADMSLDDKINYLDYVKVYNKIKELKGGTY